MSSTIAPPSSPDSLLSAAVGKHLTFALGSEAYGIPVVRVREIIRIPEITRLPQMPASVKGVINLRGKIVPVLDLRLKFGQIDPQTTNRTCIIVVHVPSEKGEEKFVGLIVDAVEEVIQISEESLEPPPDFGAHRAIDYIMAMAKMKDGVKTLLHIDKIIQGDAEVFVSSRENPDED